MGRMLGIDYGRRRLGLALSDPLGLTAQPIGTIEADRAEDALERVRAVMKDREVELVVLGLPRNMDGSLGPMAEEVRDFGARLEASSGVPVVLFDERLTTSQAHEVMKAGGMRHKKRRGKVDTVAAQLLLQAFLDSRAG